MTKGKQKKSPPWLAKLDAIAQQLGPTGTLYVYPDQFKKLVDLGHISGDPARFRGKHEIKSFSDDAEKNRAL